jgi:alkylation response protein AidB-like acyl-CoA dehydrogenase
MSLDQKELDDFRAEVRAWFEENKPADPGFLLPQSFMEVGSDEQFTFLRDWQRKVYEAGYLGLAWPGNMAAAASHKFCKTSRRAKWCARKCPS